MLTPSQSTPTTASNALSGLRIAITRAAEEANSPAAYLLDLGAEVLHYPSLRTVPLDDNTALDRAVQSAAVGQFDWLVLTTASAVFALAERLAALGIERNRLAMLSVAAFGSNTRLAAAEVLQVDVDRVAESTSLDSLAEAIPLSSGTRVLLLQPDNARSRLADQLAGRGAHVTALAAYHPVIAQGGDAVPTMLWAGAIDAVIFTSEASLRYFAKRLSYEGGTLSMLDDVCVACLDPHTAEVAAGLGLNVRVVAEQHTPHGLARALTAYFAEQ